MSCRICTDDKTMSHLRLPKTIAGGAGALAVESLSAQHVNSDSGTVAIGDDPATTTVNMGSAAHVQSINIGTGTAAKTITLGAGSDDTVVINALVEQHSVVHNYTAAKTYDVNYQDSAGGTSLASLSGIQILENTPTQNSIVGYMRTNADRDGFEFQAPLGSGITLQNASTSAATVILDSVPTTLHHLSVAADPGQSCTIAAGGTSDVDVFAGSLSLAAGTSTVAGRAAGDVNIRAGDCLSTSLYGGSVSIQAGDGGSGAGSINIGSAASAAVTRLNCTTDSVSSTTGALVLAGGVGVAKSIIAGGNIVSGGQVIGSANGCYLPGIIQCVSTTDTTSTSTGALVVSGGCAVARRLNVGLGIGSRGQVYVQHAGESLVSVWSSAICTDGTVYANRDLHAARNVLCGGSVNGWMQNTTSGFHSIALTGTARQLTWADCRYALSELTGTASDIVMPSASTLSTNGVAVGQTITFRVINSTDGALNVRRDDSELITYGASSIAQGAVATITLLLSDASTVKTIRT